MTVPLSGTRLTEIRNLDFLDGAITEFDRSSAAVAATRTLLREVDRLRAELAERHYDSACPAVEERDRLRAQVLAASTVKCWTNEDGRRFVFADDLAFALGYTPTADPLVDDGQPMADAEIEAVEHRALGAGQ